MSRYDPPARTDVRVIAGSTEPLFTIEECRQQLELVAIDQDSDGNQTHPDDAMILRKLGEVVAHAEKETGLSIARKTYQATFERLPGTSYCRGGGSSRFELVLPNPPVIEILSLTYATRDSDDLLAYEAIDPALYTLHNYKGYAVISPALDQSWPTALTVNDAVRAQYVAGFSEDSDGFALPENFRGAIMLGLGHLYEHRSDATEKALSTIPNGFNVLLAYDRIRFAIA